MKIGILTIHDSPNYGACLQCYALWKYLSDQGYDCEIIDLHRPGAHPDYIPSRKYRRTRPVQKSLLKNLKLLLKRSLGKKPLQRQYYNEESKIKFDAFNSLYTKGKPYNNIDEFFDNPPQYDVYISGSDQLWNPTQIYCIEPYFLTFVSGAEKKKISFSTSIGITELTDKEKDLFKQWLSDFTAISVREKQAKELLSSFVDREVIQTSDPTFLLLHSEWKEIANYPEIKTPYILYFALHWDRDLLDYCKRLSAESGLPLYVVNQSQPSPTDGSYFAIKDAGPRDFIGYIANADMVITDSFHGTVFSIIMGSKNFYTYIAPNSNRGSRIEDLLNTFSLSNHILNNDFERNYKELQGSKPDKDMNMSIIQQERKRSASFLIDAISK